MNLRAWAGVCFSQVLAFVQVSEISKL